MENVIRDKDYRIVSISLLDYLPDPQETKERYVEENFYNFWPGKPNEAVVDRTPSYYFNFAIGGALLSPELFPSGLLKKVTKYYKYIASDPKNIEVLFNKTKI